MCFLFKQKTAYELRISDWSSDVCSSDLLAARYYEGPRPEGVSTQNEAITTTFYIPAAAIGDMYEIEASQIAVDRAKSAEVKAFARQMIMDHSKTSQKLEDFVTNNPDNIAIPENMDGRRSAMIENQIGRANVRTPVTNAHLECRLMLEKKK